MNLWQEGAWEYVDVNVPPLGNLLPATMNTNRINLANFYQGIQGRLENMDTLILIVGDRTDERNIDQDQVKIRDTVAKLTVTPRPSPTGADRRAKTSSSGLRTGTRTSTPARSSTSRSS